MRLCSSGEHGGLRTGQGGTYIPVNGWEQMLGHRTVMGLAGFVAVVTTMRRVGWHIGAGWVHLRAGGVGTFVPGRLNQVLGLYTPMGYGGCLCSNN